MKPIPQAYYMSPEEIDALVKQREIDAASIQPGKARQSILKEVAQLRTYAAAKRWIESPEPKSGARSRNNQIVERHKRWPFSSA